MEAWMIPFGEERRILALEAEFMSIPSPRRLAWWFASILVTGGLVGRSAPVHNNAKDVEGVKQDWDMLQKKKGKRDEFDETLFQMIDGLSSKAIATGHAAHVCARRKGQSQTGQREPEA